MTRGTTRRAPAAASRAIAGSRSAGWSVQSATERPDHASAGQRTRFEREARLLALPELAPERGGMAYQAVEEVDHDDGLGRQFGRRSCDDEGPRLEVVVRGDLNQEGYASVRRGGGHA